MNATNKTEVAMLAQLSSLAPAQRAEIALSSGANRVKLMALAKESAGILSVTTVDARKEAHTAGMALKNMRTTIRAVGKTAREDVTAFSKAVIAEEDALVALIEPEEARVFKLRDEFDSIEKARKEAAAAAERARIAKIAERIAAIRQYDRDVIVICKTAASTQETVNSLEALVVSEELFEERFAEAETLKAATLEHMREVLATRIAAEAAEAQRLAEIEEQSKRIAAERAELAQLREEAAERASAAKAVADAIAAEQAAEAARLAAVAAAHEAERRRLAEQQAAADARDAAASEAAQPATQAAPLPPVSAEPVAHAAAPETGLIPPATWLPVPSSAAEIIDADVDSEMTDDHILAFGAEFDMEVDELIPRLERFIADARAGALACAA